MTDLPDDLLQAQRAWYAVYQQLAAAAPNTSTTRLRRQLQHLSALVVGHPFWKTPAGTPAARMRLKGQAWPASTR